MSNRRLESTVIPASWPFSRESWVVLPRAEIATEQVSSRTISLRCEKLADVPLYWISSRKSFPAVLPWHKKAVTFDIPGPQKPERGHIRQNRPFVSSQNQDSAALVWRYSVSPQTMCRRHTPAAAPFPYLPLPHLTDARGWWKKDVSHCGDATPQIVAMEQGNPSSPVGLLWRQQDRLRLHDEHVWTVSAVRKTPVDSQTYSAPCSPKGMSAGSRVWERATFCPSITWEVDNPSPERALPKNFGSHFWE